MTMLKGCIRGVISLHLLGFALALPGCGGGDQAPATDTGNPTGLSADMQAQQEANEAHYAKQQKKGRR